MAEGGLVSLPVVEHLEPLEQEQSGLGTCGESVGQPWRTVLVDGRYAIACFLSVGSDDSILEFDGPPPAGDAAPHTMHGMIVELTVVP